MGLHRAGFDVVGVDIVPQPNYPFAFVQADALSGCIDLTKADFIWASPPCQAASVGAARWRVAGREYPQLIPATRALLEASGVPFVIENVVGAPIRADLVLTGPMFGLKTYRRRHFEFGNGFYCMGLPLTRVLGPKTAAGFVTVAGHGGDGPNSKRAFAEALDIDWMSKVELTQAIPPAYSQFIARAA